MFLVQEMHYHMVYIAFLRSPKRCHAGWIKVTNFFLYISYQSCSCCQVVLIIIEKGEVEERHKSWELAANPVFLFRLFQASGLRGSASQGDLLQR